MINTHADISIKWHTYFFQRKCMHFRQVHAFQKCMRLHAIEPGFWNKDSEINCYENIACDCMRWIWMLDCSRWNELHADPLEGMHFKMRVIYTLYETYACIPIWVKFKFIQIDASECSSFLTTFSRSIQQLSYPAHQNTAHVNLSHIGYIQNTAHVTHIHFCGTYKTEHMYYSIYSTMHTSSSEYVLANKVYRKSHGRTDLQAYLRLTMMKQQKSDLGPCIGFEHLIANRLQLHMIDWHMPTVT